jgi:hypothetical protein
MTRINGRPERSDFSLGQTVKLYSPNSSSYKIAIIIGIRGSVYDLKIKRNNKIVTNIPGRLLDPMPVHIHVTEGHHEIRTYQ